MRRREGDLDNPNLPQTQGDSKVQLLLDYPEDPPDPIYAVAGLNTDVMFDQGEQVDFATEMHSSQAPAT